MITSKSEFFEKSRRGQLGNHLRMWSFDEYTHLHHDEQPSLVSVRNCLRGGDARVQRYRMTPSEAMHHCLYLIKTRVVDRSQLLLDESAPDDRVILQAEVMLSPRHYEMRYALYSRVGMRQAYEKMSQVSGMRAKSILEAYLEPTDYDALQEIFGQHPTSIVEFSTYEIPVGVWGSTTLFWECRDY